MRTQNYTHTKTGNVYSYWGIARPITNEPILYNSKFTANSCEDKDYKVEVYNINGSLFYQERHKEFLSTNIEGLVVVYIRGDNIWLRCKHDFFRIIIINGEVVLRFRGDELVIDNYLYEYTTSNGEVYYIINYLDSILSGIFGKDKGYLSFKTDKTISDDYIYLEDLTCLDRSNNIWGYKDKSKAFKLILSLLNFEYHKDKSTKTIGK